VVALSVVTVTIPTEILGVPVRPVALPLKVVAVITPVTTAPFVNVGAAPLRPVIELAVILDISNLLWF
jgi:hypothetical protein